MESIRKIAIVRANGIGDYCFSIPALLALRAAYSGAEIVLLGKSWHAEFLAGRPGPVDRTVVIPPYGGVSTDVGASENRDEIARFFDAMRSERFDIAFQLHGGGRYSNPFTKQLNARLTVGLRAPDAPALDRTVPYVYFQPEVLRYLEVVSLVGAPPRTLEPIIELTANDRAEADRIGLHADEPLAILHPGATDPRRRWPPEKFAAVGVALARAGARVGIIGSGDERALVDTIVKQIDSAAVSLYQRLSLGGLAAMLARSRIVVGNDSGPLHVASAVGAPTVGIFWCGNLINGGPLSRLRHRPMISWRLDCALCGRNTLYDNCAHRASFVADVPVADVTAGALELLHAEHPRSAIAA